MQSLTKIYYRRAAMAVAFFKIMYWAGLPAYYWPRDDWSKNGMTVAHMATMYVIAGFFALHGNPMSQKVTLIALGVCTVFTYLVWVGKMPDLSRRFPRRLTWLWPAFTNIVSGCSPFVMLYGMIQAMAYDFIEIEGRMRYVVLFLSTRLLAVLLIADHKYMRGAMYARWFRANEVLGSNDTRFWLAFRATFILYLISTSIDAYRENIEKIVMRSPDFLQELGQRSGQALWAVIPKPRWFEAFFYNDPAANAKEVIDSGSLRS
jgi:hypothetical protein